MTLVQEAAKQAWNEIAESAMEFTPGTQDATSHLTALMGINKGTAMLASDNEVIQIVGYAHIRWTFYALQKDALFPKLEFEGEGQMAAMRSLEDALEAIENGPALDMRKSAGAARMSLYSAFSTGEAGVVQGYAKKMRNTCERYGGPWGSVAARMDRLLEVMSG